MIVKNLNEFHNDLRKNNEYIPFSVTWELTYRCPNKCLYCYQKHLRNSNLPELELGCVLDTIDQLATMGCNNITFSGGDPFVFEGFENILYKAHENNLNIIIYTSGLIRSESIFSAISTTNVNQVEITILGGTAQTNDMLMNRNGAFDKIINNVKEMRKLGIKVLLKTTLTKQNYHEHDLMKNIAQELGADFTSNIRILNQYGIKEPITSYLKLNKDQCREYYMGNIQKLKRDTLKMCEAGKSTLGINPCGDVLPCSMYCIDSAFGSLLNNNIYEIWQGNIANTFRQNNMYPQHTCRECDKRYFCELCPGIASWSFNGVDYGHVCELADIKKEYWELEHNNVKEI